MTDPFFPPADLSRMGKFRHTAFSATRGSHHGRNVSRRSGTSPDFSDFTPYNPGDDIRNVDWNVYARTDQLFIKRFLDEREIRVSAILDGTRSMDGEGWKFSKRLCAALGLITLGADDHFTFNMVDGLPQAPFTGKGSRHRSRLIRYMESLHDPEKKDGFAAAASGMQMHAATVRYIVTDGLEELNAFQPLLRRMRRSGGDVRLIIVRRGNITLPAFGSDLRLLDSETGEPVDVTLTPSAVRLQGEREEKHFAALASLSRDFGIGMLEAPVEMGVTDFVTNRMRRAGWVR